MDTGSLVRRTSRCRTLISSSFSPNLCSFSRFFTSHQVMVARALPFFTSSSRMRRWSAERPVALPYSHQSCAGEISLNLSNWYGKISPNLSSNWRNLIQVVMAMKCRKDLMGGLYTGIDTMHIVAASKMVMRFTGMNLQPHKPIVGANAFSHESGIHQDGVLKFRGTYEIILPEDIGLSQSDESNIVLGKLSGRHALRSRLSKLGYEIDGKDLDDIFERFKEVTTTKKYITDSDIEALIYNENLNSQAIWSLVDLQVIYGTPESSKTTVRLVNSVGKEEVASSVGESPVDAAYKAINSIVKVSIRLVKYKNSAMEGIDVIASTHVIICEDNPCLPLLEPNGESKRCTFSGNGTGKDNVVSSIQAYINALNKMLGFKYLPA